MENNTLNLARRDHAGVYVPPPMFYVATFFLSLGLQRLAPLPSAWLTTNAAHAARWAVLASALLLLLPALWRFAVSRNTLITVKPAKSLQTTGIYALTRNPMYLGLLVMYAAVAFFKGNTWTFLLIAPLVLVVQAYVIRKEERYLQREFGAAFEHYKNKVRRWL
ncbi:methyltransferase family protein [Chryseolinea lacunae]|uniref:Isoprenylcysteine carboxylmethyltransferase family protein n=1 Tax=Chryseolinea lacunae TaxID=2801331 RepID=A0ABS1L3N4_9BACT|nr:isoprenylcysteine carboxylmethyltransferase family protein [Chryseolinea lacunae]MBL0745552.1 isoprenylcysteine carboxylmethyltransferase family protein [Chryseolinea lacunae]